MTAFVQLDSSLRAHITEGGYVISERLARFPLEAKSEIIVRAIGIVILVLGIWQASSPLVNPSIVPTEYHWTIPAIFLATGLGLFAFATRGFRKVIYVDFTIAELRYGRLNGYNQTRITHHVPMGRIEKLTTQPYRGPLDLSALNLHIRGRTHPVQLMSGRPGEIRALCDRLEEDIAKCVASSEAAIDEHHFHSPFRHRSTIQVTP